MFICVLFLAQWIRCWQVSRINIADLFAYHVKRRIILNSSRSSISSSSGLLVVMLSPSGDSSSDGALHNVEWKTEILKQLHRRNATESACFKPVFEACKWAVASCMVAVVVWLICSLAWLGELQGSPLVLLFICYGLIMEFDCLVR